MKKNIQNNNLGESEKKIVLGILEIYRWLAALYHAKKLNLRKIMRLFGHKSEKQKSNTDKKKRIRKTVMAAFLLEKMGMTKRKAMGEEGKKISREQRRSFTDWILSKRAILAQNVLWVNFIQ